jgi:hypothetical protein
VDHITSVVTRIWHPLNVGEVPEDLQIQEHWDEYMDHPVNSIMGRVANEFANEFFYHRHGIAEFHCAFTLSRVQHVCSPPTKVTHFAR